MSSLQELREQLAELERADIQRQSDEGARLHAEKNSPSVAGTYSHLRFEPYQYRPYPKMLFNADYEPACVEYERALRMIVSGTDQSRDLAVQMAQRRKDAATRIVKTAEEHQAAGSLWQESPALAKAALEMMERQIAEAAAVAAFDDKRLGPLAQAERRAADDASEGHLVEVAETPRRPRARASVTEG